MQENEVLESVLIFATVLVPIVTALVELVKQTVNMPKNLVPLLSFAVGLLLGFIGSPFTSLGTVLRLWAGGLSGLAATGLFELAFNKREGMTKE